MTTIQFTALVLILVVVIATIANNIAIGHLTIWNVIKDTVCVVTVGSLSYAIITLVFTA